MEDTTPATLAGFWANIDHALDTIERDKVDTFAGLKSVLDAHGNPGATEHSGAAFFGGSGGDRQLSSALRVAGWQIRNIEGGYHYTARHPETGAVVEYVEGDVYEGMPA